MTPLNWMLLNLACSDGIIAGFGYLIYLKCLANIYAIGMLLAQLRWFIDDGCFVVWGNN